MNLTYGLWRICIGIVPGVDPTVSGKHGIENAIAADYPMIYMMM